LELNKSRGAKIGFAKNALIKTRIVKRKIFLVGRSKINPKDLIFLFVELKSV
jgi:hypothetical protein